MGDGNRMWYRGDDGQQHEIEQMECPACNRTFITHEDQHTTPGPEPGTAVSHSENQYVLLPRVSSRPPTPPEVPPDLASLYNEAALILTDSPRASAALSRRAMQQVLRDEAHAPAGTPYSEIEWVLANASLPSYVTDSLHELRQIANYANHPIKSTSIGDYLEVEPGEAEWTLDTLDALFDHYFVRPAVTAARKAALTEKLNPS